MRLDFPKDIYAAFLFVAAAAELLLLGYNCFHVRNDLSERIVPSAPFMRAAIYFRCVYCTYISVAVFLRFVHLFFVDSFQSLPNSSLGQWIFMHFLFKVKCQYFSSKANDSKVPKKTQKIILPFDLSQWTRSTRWIDNICCICNLMEFIEFPACAPRQSAQFTLSQIIIALIEIVFRFTCKPFEQTRKKRFLAAQPNIWK